MPSPDASAWNDSLRRLHRSAVVSLALCALGIGMMTFTTTPPADEVTSTYSLAALALAGLAIVLRPAVTSTRSLRSFVYGSVVSMLGAVGLGLLGLLVALRESQTSVGLLYALAGTLLVLRPPPTIGDPGAHKAGP